MTILDMGFGIADFGFYLKTQGARLKAYSHQFCLFGCLALRLVP